MNPYIPTKHATVDGDAALATKPKVHTLHGLGFAGLLGGPLAIAYLIYRDLVVLGRRDMLSIAAAWYAAFIVIWLYCLFRFPPDFISQWLGYLPQAILWWIVARHLLRTAHISYQGQGGMFYSPWRAVRFGIRMFIALKILFLVIAVGFDRWAG